MLDEVDGYSVFCPFASSYTGQLRIAPDNCSPLSALPADKLLSLGKLIRHWVTVLEGVFDDPAYNIVFFLPPTDDPDRPWFVDLIPRFPQTAGFELATECWINPLSPETAARKYRKRAADN